MMMLRCGWAFASMMTVHLLLLPAFMKMLDEC